MAGKKRPELTDNKKAEIIAARASGMPVRAVAAACQVSEKTVINVYRDPGARDLFREILLARQAEIDDLFGLAIQTLHRDLVSAKNGEAAKLRAEVYRLVELGRAPVPREGMSSGVSVSVGGSGGGGAGAGMTLSEVLIRSAQVVSGLEPPLTGGSNDKQLID